MASAHAHLYKGEKLVGSVGSSADHLREWCRLLKPRIHPCAGEMRELSPKNNNKKNPEKTKLHLICKAVYSLLQYLVHHWIYAFLSFRSVLI